MSLPETEGAPDNIISDHSRRNASSHQAHSLTFRYLLDTFLEIFTIKEYIVTSSKKECSWNLTVSFVLEILRFYHDITVLLSEISATAKGQLQDWGNGVAQVVEQLFVLSFALIPGVAVRRLNNVLENAVRCALTEQNAPAIDVQLCDKCRVQDKINSCCMTCGLSLHTVVDRYDDQLASLILNTLFDL